MSQVFISHVDEEAPLASVLKHWIESAFLGQVEVFVSSHDISSGEQWFRRLEDELASARILLVLCSSKSVSMPWINFEAGAGHAKSIPIIPICHSGMNVDLLPKPLQFFQGLNAEADNFSTDVMKSIAQHLGYPREPLLPHEELSAELRQTLSGMRKQSNQTELEEEAGYLDHLVSFIEHMTELNEHISLLGSETNSLATETTIFVGQAASARDNPSQGTPRHIQRLARQYSAKLDAYVSKIEAMNDSYALLLPKIDASTQYVIEFQSPQTSKDWESIEGLLGTLDSTESSITEMKASIIGVRDTMNQIPNLQRDLRKATRRAAEQYDLLVRNLEGNVELLQRTKAILASKYRMRPRLA